MRHTILALLIVFCTSAIAAQNVTVTAVNQPANEVFRSLIEQTGLNFVYSADILKGMKITVSARNKPLEYVLEEIFRDTEVEYKIKGKIVVLKRKAGKKKPAPAPLKKENTRRKAFPDEEAIMLDEVVVVSRLESPPVETVEIGAGKVTSEEVRNTPALFGEADVIKALHAQPGVAEGTEGVAGMYVHGGNADENLYMLDNVPLYQVNHFAGLFSAFNPDIIRYIDFFKSSFPARYDGRLSSFMDVRLQNGNRDGHHGSARIGLTSGAFNISGPVGKNTAYLVGLRRSWFDVLTIPAVAILNSSQEDKTRFHYYFMDLNAKVMHRFSNNATGFASVYFGDDMLKTGSRYDDISGDGCNYGFAEDDRFDFHWGNLVAQTGLNYRFCDRLSAEFTAAYTRYFSGINHSYVYKHQEDGDISTTEEWLKTDNNIDDWIFRGDFDWLPNERSRVRFGANYVRHSFLPGKTVRGSLAGDTRIESRDSTWTYGADEFNVYIEDDWRICNRFRINAGIHSSLFLIDGKTRPGISPRLSMSYRPAPNLAFKAAYSKTTQYVHQLTESYLSLPTDQWIPVTGSFKPQTADKIAVGAYWRSRNDSWAVSVEGYMKWMHNLLDYSEEYYLKPPLDMWNSSLSQGKGSAKGMDLKIEKLSGKITGHVSYSLAWADRTFADRNGGKTYPARFDNRHTVNILVNWNINDKVTLNASWTGHSGNRFTLLSQSWEAPPYGDINDYFSDEVPLRAPVNNYRLPFYHRLDLSCVVRNSRGYWTFGLYNAYNHMNVVGIKRGYRDYRQTNEYGISIVSRPVFQKIKLLPVIPSISYTWEF